MITTDPRLSKSVCVRHAGQVDLQEPQPEGYAEPKIVWLVEYIDPRQSDEGSFQAGGFTSEEEALRLKEYLERRGFFADLHLNLVAIHRSLEDWLWDR